MQLRLNFYKEYLLLTIPLILQQFVAIVLNIIDNIMVGKLGEEAIVAVGSSNKLYFIYMLTLFGICSGGGILISQYFGKKDFRSLRKIFILTTLSALCIGVIFFLFGHFFAYEFIKLFTNEAQIRFLGQEYLVILTISFPFTAFSIACMVSLRAMGFTKIPLYVTVIATLINTFLNYCLIYGNFGFPELGTKGAAIATSIARIVEFFIFVIVILNNKYNLCVNLQDGLNISKKMLKTFVNLSTPAFLGEFTWSLGTTALYAAYALLGTRVATSVMISEILFMIGTIIFVGVSTGASIMIAQNLGAKKAGKALWVSNEIIKIAIVLAFATSVLCLIAIKPILMFYTLEQETATITIQVLIATSIIVFFKMLNWVLIVGILRSGGDTLVAFILDFIPIVLFAIPIAFLLPKFFAIPIYLLLLIVNLEEVMKLFIVLKRFRTKKWIKNLVN